MEFDFKLVDGIILLSGSLNSCYGYFAFDTGSVVTAINLKYCEVTDKQDREVTIYDGQLETKKIYEGKVASLQVGNLKFNNHHVLNLDLSYVADSLYTENIPFLGTIGMDIIAKYYLKIDYRNQKITFLEKSCEVDPTAIPFESTKGLIMTSIEINKNSYPVILDTGANRNLLLPDVLQKINSKVDIPADLGVKKFFVDVEFLNYKYNGMCFKEATATSHFKNLDCLGLIGYEFFKNKVLVIDFFTKTLFFEQY